MKQLVFALLLLHFAFEPAHAIAGKKQVRLRLTDSLSAIYDETNIYLDLGTTSNYVFPEDGQKIIDTSISAPLLYSITTDNVPCFSNSYGNFAQTIVIPIGFSVQGGSSYTFSASLLDNFESTSLLLLEDRNTGVFTDIRIDGYTITLSQREQNDNRFYLHVSMPAVISTTDASCSNDDGLILISQDTSITWNSVILFDNNLNAIASLGNVTGNFSFPNLSEGFYKVAFAFDIYTALVDISVRGNQVSVSLAPSTFQAAPYQTIIFTVNTTNTDWYEWDMGDQSYITGVASPDYFYTDPGTYQVVVKCSNSFGCEAYDTVTIVIDAALNVKETEASAFSVVVEDKMVRLFANNAYTQKSVAEVFNATGQSIVQQQISNTETVLNLQNQPSGIYFLKVNSDSEAFTRTVFIR